MSCKYCDLKRRKDEDDDAEWIAGEDWESDSDDGGYICPHGDGFRMLVYYDARCACTVVDNIKYCPFCGEELKAPKEPLIKDEKIRKAVRAWAEANGFTKLKFNEWADNHWILRAENKDGHEFDIDFFDNDCKKLPKYVYDAFYTISELCGEEEE